MKKGIDISYCQKGIHLQNMKNAGVEFVIIRAGVSTRVDTEFVTHVTQAEKIGLPYGIYWYSTAMSVTAARQEALKCLETIAPYNPTYPVFFDIEEQKQIQELNNEIRTGMVETFCDIIKNAGYKAGLYINPSWMENYVYKKSIIGKYDIWLAHWTESPDKPSKYDYGQTIWQWGLQKIDGMTVDGDICYYNYVSDKITDDTKQNIKNRLQKCVDEISDIIKTI